MAVSSFSLNNLFFGFPSWGFGVTVPISIKPNPNFSNSEIWVAFLSNPAAIPTGFSKVKPKSFLVSFGLSTL